MKEPELDYTTLAVAYFEYFDERAMTFCDELEEKLSQIETKIIALSQENTPPLPIPSNSTGLAIGE